MNVVIMAGGKGNRLWPRSAADKPKQFLPLTGDQTLLQSTYRALARHLPSKTLYVSTSESYRALVREQLPELPEERIIAEPEQRDTGPCVALCALRFLRSGQDEPLVTMPSDHHVPDMESLVDVLCKASDIAGEPGSIVTLGVVPTRPETSYGYIRAEPAPDGRGAYRVDAFVEKPDPATAAELIKRPEVYWNSGIFVWRPSTIAGEMERHQPRMWKTLLEAGDAPEKVYGMLPRISVDYAVIEKADRLYTIPVRFPWDDLGSWASLERIRPLDADGNVVQGEALLVESSDNIVVTDNRRTVVIGADRLIIVSTPEGLLVCHKSKEALLKSVVQRMNEA